MTNTEFQQEFIIKNTLLDGFRKYDGETICKYYPLNHFSIDALINSYLYAARKDQMNDFRENSYVGEQSNLKMIELHNNTSALTGIISLTEASNSFPFFSYYTGDKGYCIVFKPNVFNSSNVGEPLKVSYESIPRKTTFKLTQLDDIGFEHVQKYYRKESLSSFLVKDKVKWEREDEWRILANYQVDVDKIFKTSIFNKISFIEKPETRKVSYEVDFIKEIRIARNMFPINELGKEEKQKWDTEGKVNFDLNVEKINESNLNCKYFNDDLENLEFQVNKQSELKQKHNFLIFVKENNIKLKWIRFDYDSFNNDEYVDFKYNYNEKDKTLTIYNENVSKSLIRK